MATNLLYQVISRRVIIKLSCLEISNICIAYLEAIYRLRWINTIPKVIALNTLWVTQALKLHTIITQNYFSPCMNQRDKREEKLTAPTTQASKIMMIDMAEALLQFLIDLILIQKDLKSVSTVGSRRRQRLKDSRLRNPRSILHTIIYLILSGSMICLCMQTQFPWHMT